MFSLALKRWWGWKVRREDLICLYIMLLSLNIPFRSHSHSPTTALAFPFCVSFTLFHSVRFVHFKWHSKMSPCWLLASFLPCYPIHNGLYNLSSLISAPFYFSFIKPSGFSFLSPALCLIYFLLMPFHHFHWMCDWSKFEIAEMEVGSRREVGGANDRIWARCKQNSWRCRVMSVTVEKNTKMKERRERAGGPAGALTVSLLQMPGKLMQKHALYEMWLFGIKKCLQFLTRVFSCTSWGN